ETNAAGGFHGEVAPGAHAIELSKDGFASARFEAQFNPGRGPVRPTPAQLAMAKSAAPQPPPPTPPAPDNKKADTDAQEWAAVAGSNKVDDLQEYLGRHRGGPHARDAQARIDQLQQADAVRRDDADWNGLDKNNRAALQDYLNRHSGGRHAQDAQTQLQALEKTETDAAAAAATAAEHKKSQDRVDQKKASDTQSIQAALSDFAAAYNKLDARTISQVASPAISQTFNAHYFGQFKSIVYQLTPSAAPVINGDSATVVCNRNMVSAVAKSGEKIPGKADHVRVTLVHAGGRWMIQAIDQM
ncbi:MAG TPA: hypothetical protein VG225_16455, partial [Terracidiphilus sp.]|nr:hypothetical protein [Terracidiphilus sp.]